MANGIDVYTKYQRVTSWPAVRAAGTDFVYIKLSDGVSVRDDNGYTRGAQKAGIKAGGYHYAQPGSPRAQADLFINRCETVGATDLAPALDLELPFQANQAAIDFAGAFLTRVKARGHRPCLYANNAMLRVVRGPVKAAIPETLIWAARYGAKPTVDYDVWQWSDAGRVNGITSSSVDLNKGPVPLNVPVSFHELVLTMNLTDKVTYKNRDGRIVSIPVHDVLARISLLFDDYHFGAAGQRQDGPVAHMQRAQFQAAGIPIPESVQ